MASRELEVVQRAAFIGEAAKYSSKEDRMSWRSESEKAPGFFQQIVVLAVDLDSLTAEELVQLFMLLGWLEVAEKKSFIDEILNNKINKEKENKFKS